MNEWADGPLEWRLWAALERAGRVVGPRPVRALAAAAMRLAAARGERADTKARFRVARRTPVPTDGLFKVPDAWWAEHPRVRVRRHGLRLELDLRDNLQRTVYFTGAYERPVMALLEAELRPGDVAVDVGAHVGVHALAMARRGARVVAFEPTPDSAAALRAAAARNGLAVEVVELALGDAAGTVELLADPRYGAADAGVRSQFGAGEVVARARADTFDAWAQRCGLDRLDVVKVDVEGAEVLVLRGMGETLARLRPWLVIVEIKDVVMERGPGDEAQLHALLAAAGYAPTGAVLQHNAVFRRAA